MGFETYTPLYDGGDEGVTLRPRGEGVSFSLAASVTPHTRYCLFTVGETEQYYQWKDEPDGPLQYRSITDSLDTAHAVHDRFCLNLSSDAPAPYIRRAYKKVMWPPRLSYLSMTPVPTAWTVGLTVSGRGVRVESDGFLRLRVDIRLKKEGVSRHSVSAPPDRQLVIPFPCGDYGPTRLSRTLEIPPNTAHVGVFVEGKDYAGEVYAEQPTLLADGQNLLPCFSDSVADRPQFDWSGQYLSRKEWPVFRVCLNDEEVFCGEVFERSHRYAEWEIPLPADRLQSENTVTYELLSDYHDPVPYTIYEVGLIARPDAPVSLIVVSPAAAVGGLAHLLMRTARPHTRITLTPQSAALAGGGEFLFETAGLHGLCLSARAAACGADFLLESDDAQIIGQVERIVEKADDRVITGSGDMIYVRQDPADMEEFISWYVANQLGNFITIRPTYRWSGTRTLNRPLWRWFSRLVDELSMKYVLMVDGREVPGLAAQPDDDDLAGKGYLGRQDHERDGMEFYWGQRCVTSPTAEQAADLMEMAWQEDAEHVNYSNGTPARFCRGETIYLYSDRDRPRDTQQCYHLVMAHLNEMRNPTAHRHTGPANVFKYLYAAGYTWLGAETMYSTMEPLMGFLRGVARDKAMPSFGVHHAVQWSSSPHAAPEHVRRFRLALYESYLLGATDINTEEGFWHMEEYYEHHHRFGAVCQAHAQQQRDFYRYVCTHTRSGAFYTPFAFLHGQEDGSNFFSKNQACWGLLEPPTAAEDSWDLLRVIYPQAVIGSAVYRHNCPTDRPVGYHTSTPFGQADMPPAEGRAETLAAYRLLMFLEFHRMDGEVADRLYARVQSGATLLLTRAHLTCTSDIEAVRRGELAFVSCALSFTNDAQPQFVIDTVDGVEVSVCVNAAPADEVWQYTDSGRPFLCRYRVGEGEVLLFNTPHYPSHAAVRPAYERAISEQVRRVTAAQAVWAETGDDTAFAVYAQSDGSRHVYALAVDWYRPPQNRRRLMLRVDTETYPLWLPFGVLIKCVVRDNRAAWACDETGEVLEVTAKAVRVQGVGTVEFCVAAAGTVTHHTVDFSAAPIQWIDT